ncbi:ligase [Lithospermum erythrorhizon]|uniref:Ligase n=1 Tax=Lithospermum erythrorhizon TaxID=34254 RepID=A0AAV3Q9Z6_LITER
MDQLKPSLANSCPLTPLSFLERAAIVYGDCPSIIYNNTTHTWSQTYNRCLRVASSISSLGIKTGQVVSVIAPNIPAMYELHFAIPMAGAVINTVNTRLDSRTISVLLQHAESRLVFVDYQSCSVVQEALSMFKPESPRPILILITEEASVSETEPEFYTYQEMVQHGNPNFNWIKPENEYTPLTLNYTSGTTSAPKGVVHSHRGTFIVALDSLLEWSVPKEPVFLWTLPMFHANGWSFTWGMAAVGGVNICLRKFNAKVIYSLINRHRVTHMCATPVVLNMLCNSPDENKLSHQVAVSTAGAPPPAAVLHKTEALGFVVSHGYGMTETGGHVISCTWKKNWEKFPASEKARMKARQGVRTVGMAQVDVVEPESGVCVERDGSSLGEVVLRGACIMLGYFKDPEATSKCMKNGWFYTGDVAVIHPDGYLEIKDRSKDVIISGGENLSSVEVESVLYMHPTINEAAVVAKPDEFWGETPCAFVSLKEKSDQMLQEKEIIEFCRARLPHYMVPKKVVIKAELPKTSTGKIQKFVLRELAKSMDTSRISRM